MGKDGAQEALCAGAGGARGRRALRRAALEAALRAVAEELEHEAGGGVPAACGSAITGRTVSAGIFESLALLGREESLARIDAALERLRDSRGRSA